MSRLTSPGFVAEWYRTGVKRSLLPLLLTGCTEEPPIQTLCDRLSTVDADAVARQGSNVLIIISDDIGVDKTGAYGLHPEPAPTPNIDALACAGVVFTQAYAAPTCSPARAALLTGRLGRRTGIGRWIYADTNREALPLEEWTLAEALAESPFDYTAAALGKWHLVGFEYDAPEMHPLEQGFTHYAGSLGNPLEALDTGNVPRGYTNWQKITNGERSWSSTYMNTETTDDALALLPELPEPWLLYVAFNGAHTPLHVPPAGLLTEPIDENASDLQKFDAMVEATDAEIGRLLDGIPDDVLSRTTIVYVTDNGTPGHGISEPWDSSRGKGTLFDSGVRVPLIVTGPLIDRPRTTDILVHFVDIFSTVVELAGVSLSAAPNVLDGQSFFAHLQDGDVPGSRTWVFAEHFYRNGPPPYRIDRRMLRDQAWKYIVRNEREDGQDVTEELFFSMNTGALEEGENLLDEELSGEALRAYDRLKRQMEQQLAAMPYEY